MPLIVRWLGHIPAGTADARLVSLMDVAAETLFALDEWIKGTDQRAQIFESAEEYRRALESSEKQAKFTPD